MALPLQFPLINGFRYAWASVEIKLAGQVFYAVEANYSRKRQRQMVYVNHPDPVGKTIGKNEYVADITFLLSEFNSFEAALVLLSAASGTAAIGSGYGNVFFDVLVTYNENGSDTILDTIRGCTLDGVERTMQEGPDAIKIKCEMSPLKIIFNNQDDLAFPLTAPVGV